MFIIIYVGAIAILFLFVVMMLNSKKANLIRSSIKYLPAGFLISLGCLISLVNPFFFSFKIQEWENISVLNINWYDLLDAALDIEIYGQLLYTYFVLELLVAGLILLVVTIGVVYFTNIYNNKQTMDQSTFKQLSISSNYFLI